MRVQEQEQNHDEHGGEQVPSVPRVSREQVEQMFDVFDIFSRGEIKSSELVNVATCFCHFLDCTPGSLYSELSGQPTVKKEKGVEVIWKHVCGAQTPKEANTLYNVFTSDTQAGPLDSIEVVGSRFGASAKAAMHPDGYKLDPLLMSIATRATGGRASNKRLADSVLFVQNSAAVLFPGRPRAEALHPEEFEDLFCAAQLLAPGANKRLWKRLHEYARSKDSKEEEAQQHKEQEAEAEAARAAAAAAAQAPAPAVE